MSYFVPCTSTFEDAVKDPLSARYWKVLIDTDNDGNLEDVTEYVSNNNVSGSGRMEGANHESVSNQYKVILKNSDNMFTEGDFANAKCAIEAKVGTAEYIRIFTGYINDDGCNRKVINLNDDEISITMLDMTKRRAMSRKCDKSILVNFKISDPSSPSTSLFHKLADMLDLSASDLDIGGAINYTKPYMPYEGKESVWKEMQLLAAQYLGLLTFRYDGKLRFRSRFESGYSEPTAEWTFSEDENNVYNFSSKGGRIIANRVVTNFDFHVVLSQRVIYKNVDNYSVVTQQILIDVPAGEYYPGGSEETDVAELKYVDPSSGIEYPIGINMQTPTIGTPGSGSDIECNNGLLTLHSFNGVAGTDSSLTEQKPNASQIILKNNTGSTITITKLELRGQPIRIDQKVDIEDMDSTITDEWEYRDKSIPGKYAVNSAQATITTQWWVNYGKVKRKEYEIETYWIPQIQEGALVNLVLPSYSISKTCQVLSWNHIAAKGPNGKIKTRLVLREWVSFSPVSTPEKVINISQPEQSVAFTMENRPTYSELQEGYTKAGGTITPSQVIISECKAVGVGGILLMWDRQTNLTNFSHYEIQVSDNESDWYELRFDSVDWKGTLGQATEHQSEILTHSAIPHGGTIESPVGRTLYYRIRRVTISDTEGTWSSNANATTRVVGAGDHAANSIYANNIIVSEIQSMFMRVGDYCIVGYTGAGTWESPVEGDRVNFIDLDEYTMYERTGGSWVVKLRIGGAIAGVFIAWFMGLGVCHPENPPDSAEIFPGATFRIFQFENDYEDQGGNDDWTTKNNLTFDSSYKKFGSYSLYATSGNLGTLTGVLDGTSGESQAGGVWIRPSLGTTASLATNPDLFYIGSTTGNDVIRIAINKDTDVSVLKVSISVRKSNVLEYYNVGSTNLNLANWNYVGFVYDADTDIVYLIVNNVIEASGVIGGTWATTTFRLGVHAYNNHNWDGDGTYFTIYVDELLFAYDTKINANVLVQHYNHGIVWSTDYAYKDYSIRPAVGGRVVLDANTKINGILNVDNIYYGNDTSYLKVSGSVTFTFISATGLTISGINNQSCTYTKIGDVINITGYIIFTITAGTIGQGDYVVLSGLPYSPKSYGSASLNNLLGSCHVYNSFASNINAVGIIQYQNSSNRIYMYLTNSIGTPTNTDQWFINMSYHI